MVKKKEEVKKEEVKEEVRESCCVKKSEKEKLLELYQTLKDLRINSISDLENLIAKTK